MTVPATDPATDLAERYGTGSRRRRPVVVALAVVLLLAGAAWVTWAAGHHGRPSVTSQLAAYQVRGEHAVRTTFTVTRRDPRVAASCLLQAVAADHSGVGELTVPVRSGPASSRVSATLRTERRATTVELLGCTAPDQPGRR